MCVYNISVEKLQIRGWHVTSGIFATSNSEISTNKISNVSAPRLFAGHSELSLDKYPKVGETATLTVNATNNDTVKPSEVDLDSLTISITEGLEFVGINSSKIEYVERYNLDDEYEYSIPLDLESGESKTFTVTIKAVKEGLHFIGSYYFEGEDGLAYYVTSDEIWSYDEYRKKFANIKPQQAEITECPEGYLLHANQCFDVSIPTPTPTLEQRQDTIFGLCAEYMRGDS